MEIKHKEYIIDIDFLQYEVDYSKYKNYTHYDSSSIICIATKDLEGNVVTKALLNSDGATIQPYEKSYLIYESDLIICIGSEVCSLDITTLDLNWQTTCDTACCFTIQEYFGDYLIHGELDITRLSKAGQIVWQFSGKDIFVNLDGEDEFIVTAEGNIIATDFQGNKYYLDPNGNDSLTQKK